MLPDMILVPQSQYDRVHTPAVEMRKVFECTHFLPDAWKGRAESFDVRDSFLALYPHKAILVLQVRDLNYAVL